MVNKRPSGHRLAWLKYDDDGEEVELNLENVRLTAIIEG
jgi:ParB family chromosome partitioning protein